MSQQSGMRRVSPPKVFAWIACLAAGAAVAHAAESRAPEESVAEKPAAEKPAAQTQPTTQAAAEAAAADAAIKFLVKGVAELPSDPTIATRLAGALLGRVKQNQDFTLYARAEAACAEALKRDPRHIPAMLTLGSCQMARHRFDDAVKAAEQALAVRADLPEALGLRGDAYLQLGELGRARADYEKALAAGPTLVAHARLGHLRFAEGDAAGAVESLRAAIKAGEQRAESPAVLAWGCVRLGELMFRTGDWEKADAWYANALDLAPDDPDALDHMAELHAARGEYQQAAVLSDRAIAATPRPEYFQHRGDLLAAAGEHHEAFAWHERALAGYLESMEAGEALYFHHLAGFYCDVDAFRDPAAAIAWARRDYELRRTPATLSALAWAYYHAGRYADAVPLMDKAFRTPSADCHVLYHAGLIYARAGNTMRGRAYLRRAADANPKFNEFHFHR